MVEDTATNGSTEIMIAEHPRESLLRSDRLPHIWCPGCGIGTALNCTIGALQRSELNLQKTTVVSGIGCSGRAAGYLNLDGFHTTHGRAIPVATGLKLANDELNVLVFSGDGDLVAIGGNHLIHAARRNMDMTVICINNFNYGMTGGQMGPTTPTEALTSTSPRGNLEHPFNIARLAAAAGATYVARWTVLQARRLERSIRKALQRPGFSIIEVISPCPTLFVRFNRPKYGKTMMDYLENAAVVRSEASPWEVDIELGGEIICGEFVETERSTFYDRIHDRYGELYPSMDLALLHRPPVALDKPEVVGKAHYSVSAIDKSAIHPSQIPPLPGMTKADYVELRFCGFGGQGIILAGQIVGEAAALHDGREVTLARSYGPESRGGACSTKLIVSENPIPYPHVTRPSLIVAMSQEAYNTYHDQLTEEGLMLIDADLVEPVPRAEKHVVSIPATRIAEHEVGRRVVANIVMLGGLTALTEVVSREAVENVIVERVPEGTEEMNRDAFSRGWKYGHALLEAGEGY